MQRPDPFERLLLSLHDAALDDALWPATSNLIDEACGAVGGSLIVNHDAGTLFARTYARGQPYEDLQRDYFDTIVAVYPRPGTGAGGPTG